MAAGKSAILSVRIVGDATEASKAFNEAEKRAKAMQGTFEKASKGAGIALAGLGNRRTIRERGGIGILHKTANDTINELKKLGI